MKNFRLFLMVLFFMNLFHEASLNAQNDTLPKAVRDKVISIFQNFQIGFYIDAYYSKTIDAKDTSNIIPYYSNSQFANQIRMNLASMWIKYNSEHARGYLAIQYGDAPMLLTNVSEQFIKYLRQANFGFKIYKGLWIDFGYMLDPVGVESSWPILNKLSTVTVGGYYEPGSLLGIKLSYVFSDKLNAALYACNPYSIAYGKNTGLSIAGLLNYKPKPNIGMTYTFLFGNQAPKGAPKEIFQMYNNLVFDYTPAKWFNVTAQFDFAIQGNTNPLDSNKIGNTITLMSGFLQTQFVPIKLISLTLRGEFFYDPDAMLSHVYYKSQPQPTGLKCLGATAGIEIRPLKDAYLRMEYRALAGNPDEAIFYGNEDQQQVLTFTTGLRF